MKRYAKIIAYIVGLIYSISQIYDVIVTYKSNFRMMFERISQWDFLLIGQVIMFIGAVVFVTAMIVLLLKRIFNLKRPKRDALDYFVENILPEDQLENSEPKHKKKLRKFNVINFGLYIIVFGICLLLGVKLLNIVISGDNTHKDPIALSTGSSFSEERTIGLFNS